MARWESIPGALIPYPESSSIGSPHISQLSSAPVISPADEDSNICPCLFHRAVWRANEVNDVKYMLSKSRKQSAAVVVLARQLWVNLAQNPDQGSPKIRF